MAIPLATQVDPSIRSELAEAANALAQAGISSGRLDAELLLAHVQGCSRMELYLSANLSRGAQQEFRHLVARRCRGEPLQYCIGIAWFYGLAFGIGPGAFIPRQETEILCQQAIAHLRAYPRQTRVIELCCGPGALGITLLRELEKTSMAKVEREEGILRSLGEGGCAAEGFARRSVGSSVSNAKPWGSTLTKNVSDCRITAIDASDEALSYARANALRHGVEGRITFIQKDIRTMDAADIAALPQADLLLCNPPYVPTAARAILPADVLQEPWLALDGGKEGLDFYRLLIPRWHSAVREGGGMLLEHGDDQGPVVQSLLRAAGAYDEISAHCDLSGRERVVQAVVRHG